MVTSCRALHRPMRSNDTPPLRLLKGHLSEWGIPRPGPRRSGHGLPRPEVFCDDRRDADLEGPRATLWSGSLRQLAGSVFGCLALRGLVFGAASAASASALARLSRSVASLASRSARSR